MLILEVTPGRFYVNFDYRQSSNGSISGYSYPAGQKGFFTYRSAEHFLEGFRITAMETFTADEIAMMKKHEEYCETRKEYDKMMAKAAARAKLWDEHVGIVKAEIERRPIPLSERSLRRTREQFSEWDVDYWRAVHAAATLDLASPGKA